MCKRVVVLIVFHYQRPKCQRHAAQDGDPQCQCRIQALPLCHPPAGQAKQQQKRMQFIRPGIIMQEIMRLAEASIGRAKVVSAAERLGRSIPVSKSKQFQND